MTRPGDDVGDLVRRLLDRHLPGHPVETVTSLGAGLDHSAYAVDGELVVRLSRADDPAERSRRVLREARLLSTVAPRSPLPVPAPVTTAADDGCLVYRKLPGRPLLDLPAQRQTQLAGTVGGALGGLLAALHAIPPAVVAELVDVDDTPPAEWLAEARGADVDTAVPAPHRPSVRAFLDAPPPVPAERLVFSHNDLGIEHVLVDDDTGRITGILDWTDAAVTDPARDFGLILRDLGPDALGAALTAYGTAVDAAAAFRRRIGFLARCALLEDLAYGVDGGWDAYVEKSLRGMRWLFPA